MTPPTDPRADLEARARAAAPACPACKGQGKRKQSGGHNWVRGFCCDCGADTQTEFGCIPNATVVDCADCDGSGRLGVPAILRRLQEVERPVQKLVNLVAAIQWQGCRKDECAQVCPECGNSRTGGHETWCRIWRTLNDDALPLPDVNRG